jgi:predicted Na+-dependent transporter
MLRKLPRLLSAENISRSLLCPSRNSSNAVALANTEYGSKEAEGNPFIIMHGLFGSKSNW